MEEDLLDLRLLLDEVKPTRGQEDTIDWPRGTFNMFCVKYCYDLLSRVAGYIALEPNTSWQCIFCGSLGSR